MMYTKVYKRDDLKGDKEFKSERGIQLEQKCFVRCTPFDIRSALQHVQPWQEYQHSSSPLEGVGIFVFVKMVETWTSEQELLPRICGATLTRHSSSGENQRVEMNRMDMCVYLCVDADTTDEKQLVSQKKNKT
ncbi:hypothetical protein JOB18_038206 [Solea senegalensis]|uniref:Uncharacterized protein n=1 Tax=Solea senegalensis TaxID=28829 RepID=A0AAV6SQ09_SOLSE|nr:hypothetical protein JOB18_038206 [Solea senegalensis]